MHIRCQYDLRLRPLSYKTNMYYVYDTAMSAVFFMVCLAAAKTGTKL